MTFLVLCVCVVTNSERHNGDFRTKHIVEKKCQEQAIDLDAWLLLSHCGLQLLTQILFELKLFAGSSYFLHEVLATMSVMYAIPPFWAQSCRLMYVYVKRFVCSQLCVIWQFFVIYRKQIFLVIIEKILLFLVRYWELVTTLE